MKNCMVALMQGMEILHKSKVNVSAGFVPEQSAVGWYISVYTDNHYSEYSQGTFIPGSGLICQCRQIA